MVLCAKLPGCLPTGYIHLSNGYTVEYRAGQGDPILIVPGLAGGIELLEPLVDELQKSHRVITYQIRGEGRGMFDRNFGFRQLVADLDEIIAPCNWSDPG